MYIKRFATNANITLRYPNNCVFQNQNLNSQTHCPENKYIGYRWLFLFNSCCNLFGMTVYTLKSTKKQCSNVIWLTAIMAYYTLDNRGTHTFLKVHLDTNLVDYTLI